VTRAAVIRLKPYELLPFHNSSSHDEHLLRAGDGRYLRLSEDAAILLRAVDGCTSQEASARATSQLKTRVAPDDIEAFVAEFLVPHDLLEGTDARRQPGGLHLHFHLPILGAGMLTPVGRILGILYLPPVIWTAALALVVSLTLFVATRSYAALDFSSIPLMPTVVLILLGFLVHEFGHVAAACHYGAPPRTMGVGLYLARPVLFVDLTDCWALSRASRVMIDLGGVYFQSLYVLVLFAASLVRDSYSLRMACVMSSLTILINMNPFLRMDGYWVMTDWLGVVNLSKKSMRLPVRFIEALRGTRREGDRDDIFTSRFVLIYGLVYCGVTLAVLLSLIVRLPDILSGVQTHVADLKDALHQIEAGHVGEGLRAMNEYLLLFLAPLYLVAVALVTVVTRLNHRTNEESPDP